MGDELKDALEEGKKAFAGLARAAAVPEVRALGALLWLVLVLGERVTPWVKATLEEATGRRAPTDS